MRVPSAVMPEARNAVINPPYPTYRNVTPRILGDFTFDARMLKEYVLQSYIALREDGGPVRQ
ncbi:MAG: hypothetical protein ABI659_04690 [Nitrosospira sp.]